MLGVDERPADNIYGEQPYGDASGRRIAIRYYPLHKKPGGINILDLQDGTNHEILSGKPPFPAFHAWGEWLYYAQTIEGKKKLRRCNYLSLKVEDVAELPADRGSYSYGTVSPDHRYYAVSVRPPEGGPSKVHLLDLQTNQWSVLLDKPGYHAKHEQFSARRSQSRADPAQSDAQGEGRTAQRAGDRWHRNAIPCRPALHPASHPATKPGLAPAAGFFSRPAGALPRTVTSGPRRRGKRNPLLVCEGRRFGHVSVSRNGKYWIGDSGEKGIPIYIGSFATGRLPTGLFQPYRVRREAMGARASIPHCRQQVVDLRCSAPRPSPSAWRQAERRLARGSVRNSPMSFSVLRITLFFWALWLTVDRSCLVHAAPAPPETINVAQCGAVGDGQQDDAPAIQKALDSGAAVVVIPAGQYRISQALRIGSDTTLKADPKAVIRLADGAGRHVSVFLLTNRNPGNSNSGITVEGGIWDGNNEHNRRGQDGDFFGYTGTAINFVNVKHLVIRKLTVRNPDAFSIRLGEVEDFLVEDIVLDHPVRRPNQDGVHVGGFSKRGVIRRIKALVPDTPNDDMVAINADDDVERVLNLGMRRGPIRDIRVEDLEANGAYTFVRILSKESAIENIAVRRIKGSCRFYAVNMSQWRFPIGSGNIRNVRLEELQVTKTQYQDWAPALIHITLGARDLLIRDLVRGEDPQSARAATLIINNKRTNTIRIDDGSPQQLQELVIPRGNIQQLKLNREQ